MASYRTETLLFLMQQHCGFLKGYDLDFIYIHVLYAYMYEHYVRTQSSEEDIGPSEAAIPDN